jgi:predicted SprT family Zn-dependent metalloprotease
MPVVKDLNVGTPTKSPSKTAVKKAEIAQRKAVAARKKEFDDRKTLLAQEFLLALDEAISGGQINELAQSTGGVKIEWSKTLRSTAGRAKWKQERMKQAGGDFTYIHHASVELAERIIDDENRLLNTLAHEYCHLANYMISKIRDQPHGTSFKEWGRKCVDAVKQHPIYKHYPIEVTTKHSYEIDYKYVWLCIDCGHKYGRHSKSIDPAKARCSLCKGGLQQVKPKPRNVSPKKNTPASNNGTNKKGTVLGENFDDMLESLGNAHLS